METFKVSKYCTQYIKNNSFFLYSGVAKKSVRVSDDKIMNHLRTCSFHNIDHKTLDSLIQNEILIPDFIQEESLVYDQLLQLSKLTLIYERFPDVVELEEVISRFNTTYENICLLFICKKVNNVKDILKSYYDKLTKTVLLVVVEYIEILNVGDKINVYKINDGVESSLDFKLLYSHFIFNNYGSLKKHKIDSYNSISLLNGSEYNFLPCLDKIPTSKNINSANVLLTNHYYLKELPFSGFIIDETKIDVFLRTNEISSKCSICPKLASCGGYLNSDNIIIKCPSYSQKKEFYGKGKTQELKFETSNKLVSNREIVNYFDKMIIANTSSLLEWMYIKYLSKEYDKGFIFTKKNIRQAQYIFSFTDKIFKEVISPNSFAYHYVKTIVTSTKSYLAYKCKNTKKAIEISQEGIKHAIVLRSFKYAEIMGLFISQILMNMAKVYLYSGDIQKWRNLTLDNINFLLNLEIPYGLAECDDMVSKVPDKLKYFMLLCIIDDIMTNIVKNDFKEGLKTIIDIQVTDMSSIVNKQIHDWVLLNKCLEKGEVGSEFEDNYYSFMKSENEIMNLASLKLFLRNRIRKEHRQIYQNIILNKE